MVVAIIKKLKEEKSVQKLMFENYKDCLLNNKTIYKSQEIFKTIH